MLTLSDKWAPFLRNQPGTGMGYWITSVFLTDGRRFDDVVIDSGFITSVAGATEIPFDEPEIEKIVVNHGTRGRRR
jgi:hypothetical protein